MLDENKLKKRVILRLLGSPFTIVPFVVGMTCLTAAWALDWNLGIGVFAGLAGFLGASGAFATRLFLGSEKVVNEVTNEMVKEEQLDKQKALDELDRMLTTSDEDPRPEAALRDLRALLAALQETRNAASGLNLTSVYDIDSMSTQLFNQCVRSLEQTLKLWQTAQRLNTASARDPILEQREKIMADIQASIKQLSDTLIALQSLGSGDNSTAELSRIRDELDQSLAVAKVVEARINSLVEETDVKVHERPLQTNPQEKGKTL
jgi:hypothetical protein